jgi:S1-C subfamily serine protease
VKIEVLLHDTLENKTVYSRTFVGTGVDTGLEPHPIVLAVVDGVMKSAADPKFVKLMLKEASDAAGSEAVDDVFEIAVCSNSIVTALPEDLGEMLEAVVEIQVGAGTGTGVIISPDGWILTAAHLVDGASEIWVRLRFGPQVPAKIQRLDAHLDIALLRVAGRGYRCAQLRETERDLDLGYDVFMINLALGDERSHTISRGVVSGYMEYDGQRYIQTDASVNPGSSGGPMLSNTGVVAGITVAKLSAAGFEGVAFAVPIREAVRSMAIRPRGN